MTMTSWMDLETIPIFPTSPDNGEHIDESLTIIDGIIAAEESGGVPAERIVVAGFSQGGAMSLATGVRAQKKLAGVCVLSGWALPKQNVGTIAATCANKDTPFLICHGEADRVVMFECGPNVKQVLDGAGCSDVTIHTYPGVAHSSCNEEEAHVLEFLQRVVP